MDRLKYPEDAGSSDMSLRDLLDGLRRNWRLVAAVTISVLVLTGILLLLTSPRYESEATLRIEFEDRQSSLLANLPDIADVALPSLGGDAIDTELGVLRSRRIAEAVVDSLTLHVSALRPNIHRDSILVVLNAPREIRAGRYDYEREADGSWSLRSYSTKGTARPDAVARPGEPLSLGEVTVALSPDLAGTRHDRVRIRVQPFWEAVEDLRETLRIEKQEGRSQLVELGFRSPHPRLSADVVNQVIDTYLEYTTATSHQELRRRVDTLRDQVAEYRGELTRAEEALRDYSRDQRIVNAEEQGIAQVEMIAELTITREQAAIERAALLTLLSEIAGDDGTAGVSPYRKLTAFPSFITNQGVQSMLQTLSGLENARSELLIRRTPENQDVRRLDERIEAVEAQIHRLATDYLSTLENQIASADASLGRFEGRLAEIPDQALEYARLTRDAELMSEVYLTLQVRLKEAEVQYAIAPEEVRVIDRGLAPLEPAWPRPVVTLALATVLGMLLGMAAAVSREAVDSTVRTQEEVEAAAEVPVVGMIPRLKLPGARIRRLRPPWRRALPPAGDGGVKGALAGRGDGEQGRAAEAFQALRASLAGEEGPRLLVVTSPRQGDGKTLSSTNLAASLARKGERVLLIDGDLRAGVLHRLLGVDGRPGLADLLTGRAVAADAVKRVAVADGDGVSIDLLPAGSPGRTPGELLTAERLRPVLDPLRARYDRIIVDSPALHRVADAVVLGGVADTVLLVVRAGVTDRRLVQRTVTQLRRMGVPLGGIVLNDVDGSGGDYHALPSPLAGRV